MPYVVARTKSGRPSLQHHTEDLDYTSCGLDISQWSRAYSKATIDQIFCMKCSRVLRGS